MTAAPAAAGVVLELDQGNTRTKWRLLNDAGECLDRGASPKEQAPTWPPPDRANAAPSVRAVSVAGEADRAALRAGLLAAGYAEPRFAAAADTHGRLRSGYREPTRLGADRWVALVAATLATTGACGVLDAGSAITLDLVDERGVHEGGWIVPGLRLMRESLLRDTAGIRYEARESCGAVVPGRSTAEAVEGGTALMARDFAHRRWEAFVDRFPDAVLFVTGGDGPRLAEGLEGAVRLAPDLVLDGLQPVLG